MYKQMTDEFLNIIWNTKTINEWSMLNFDKIIFPTNLEGVETYLTVGKGDNKQFIKGIEARKRHKGQATDTTYFIRSEDLDKIPLLIKNTEEILSRQKVYNVINQAPSVKMLPEHIMNWREVIDYSGIPYHSNKIHWSLYKMKRLYARLTGQFYGRYVTESGFGKDKYPESYRLLINAASNISDPSRPKLFFAACHNKEITINELGVPPGKESYEYFNMIMRLGDGTQVLDNPKRATGGTTESVSVGNLSVCFTHNVPSYYLEADKNIFEQIYPYNVINRFYYNQYEGFCQMKPKPSQISHYDIAVQYDQFIKDWIKSVLWYEEHFKRLPNKYPEVNLDKFTFNKREERFKHHFTEFAKCVSYYAKDEQEYLSLLEEDYNSHKRYGKLYKRLIKGDEATPFSEYEVI